MTEFIDYLTQVVNEMRNIHPTDEQIKNNLKDIIEWAVFGYVNNLTPTQVVEAYSK